ncbi:MAG: putative DNA base hypermodification protein [Candidatus Poribacteria bacterium]|nr:putative DNA base hypermodification protein [Candidatus Poribacteria bacterium]
MNKTGSGNKKKPLTQIHAGSNPRYVGAPYVFSKQSLPKTTKVYDAYWELAAERQEIFFKRFRGEIPPWTDDPILQLNKFTNSYRASDRVSQYLIARVIYPDNFTEMDLFLRIILFKLFNRIETWELLERNFGQISVDNFSIPKFSYTLTKAASLGTSIYSAAYIMPSGNIRGRHYQRKHLMHLHLLGKMIKDCLVQKLSMDGTLRGAFNLLLEYPTIGRFLAYQYAIDLNYSPLLNASEGEFIVPGPGAKEGIRKCFSDLRGLTEADIIRFVTDRQELEFEQRGISFKSLWGRRLQLIDCQNLFCEVDKYARVKFPEYNGQQGRRRIKQRYRMNSDRLDYWYPPKWGINKKIHRGIKDDR